MSIISITNIETTTLVSTMMMLRYDYDYHYDYDYVWVAITTGKFLNDS